MSVGGQISKATVDQQLTDLAVGYRNLCQAAANLNKQINGAGNGAAILTALGYSTTASTSNPGGVSDEQYASNVLGYFNTLAGVYYGTVQQGGSGGTGAATFNFDNALAPMWAGQ